MIKEQLHILASPIHIPQQDRRLVLHVQQVPILLLDGALAKVYQLAILSVIQLMMFLSWFNLVSLPRMDGLLVIVLLERFVGKGLQVQQVLEIALLVIIVKCRTISLAFTRVPRERTKLLQVQPLQALLVLRAPQANIVRLELLLLRIVFLASIALLELNMQLNTHVQMINGPTREQLQPQAVLPVLMVINAYRELRISANPVTTAKDQPYIRKTLSSECLTCPKGHYCDATNMHTPKPCPSGTYNHLTGRDNVSACLSCAAGSVCPHPMTKYQNDGSFTPKRFPC